MFYARKDNMMENRYYTKEEALRVVEKHGYSLSSVADYLKDDYDVVYTAIVHGGMLTDASFRLQNNVDLIVASAKARFEQEDKHCVDYIDIVFCAKQNQELLSMYTQKYYDWDEFILEMKIYYGDSFISPIPEYNLLSAEELKTKLQYFREKFVSDCRRLYEKNYSEQDLRRNSRLSKAVRHRFLRWALTRCSETRKPFSELTVGTLQQEINRIQQEKHRFSESTGGSYPERFMSAVLSCLGVQHYKEQTFGWSKRTEFGTKRYDFYIPSLEMIIEIHGAQHYDGGFEKIGGRNLEEEQKNDKFKEMLARTNGIANYIVVNAMSSSFDFLQRSLLSNIEFRRNFEVSKINWNTVQDEIRKNDILIATPLLDEKIAYNQMLIALFQKHFVSKDAALSKQTMQVRAALNKHISKCVPTSRGLFPHEILLLQRISSYKLNEIPEWVEEKWNEHFETPISVYVGQFVDKKLIRFASAAENIEKLTVPELKKCLSDNGFDTHGTKHNLLHRVLSELPSDAIDRAVTTRYYSLTEEGIKEIVDHAYLSYAGDVNLSIWVLYELYCQHELVIRNKFGHTVQNLYTSVSPQDPMIGEYGLKIAYFLRGMKNRKGRAIK